jgi:16S rRNA (guanine527-N7)-methyltransferase
MVESHDMDGDRDSDRERVRGVIEKHESNTRPYLQLLRSGLRELGIEPNSRLLDGMALFIEELVLWNEKTNLLGTRDRDQIVIRHILDSLTVYPLLAQKKGSILDIGAGAGFPSLPLALVDPELRVTAVEKRHRRAAFIKAASVLLGMGNYRVVEGDVRDMKEQFDVVLARAVGQLSELITLAARVIKEGTMIIAFKGKIAEIDREMKSLEEKVRQEGQHNIRIQRVQVPHLKEEERNIVIIEMAS